MRRAGRTGTAVSLVPLPRPAHPTPSRVTHCPSQPVALGRTLGLGDGGAPRNAVSGKTPRAVTRLAPAALSYSAMHVIGTRGTSSWVCARVEGVGVAHPSSTVSLPTTLSMPVRAWARRLRPRVHVRLRVPNPPLSCAMTSPSRLVPTPARAQVRAMRRADPPRGVGTSQGWTRRGVKPRALASWTDPLGRGISRYARPSSRDAMRVRRPSSPKKKTHQNVHNGIVRQSSCRWSLSGPRVSSDRCAP